MTKAIFRKYRDGQIIALFPDETWNRHDRSITSYMHIGQHGAADYAAVIADTCPANEDEYREVLQELVSIGYCNLRVVHRKNPMYQIKK